MTIAERYTHIIPSPRDRRLAWLDLDELAATPVGSSYMDQARCGGKAAERLSDLFFPDDGGEAADRPAVEFCSRCPVRVRCLAANLYEDWGVWGGTTRADRKEIRKRLEARRAG